MSEVFAEEENVPLFQGVFDLGVFCCAWGVFWVILGEV